MDQEIRKERPRKCKAAWCTNTSEYSTLFTFPANPLRAKQWEKAMVFKKGPLCKRSICKDHFEDKDFTSTLKTKLNYFAVPTTQVKIKEEKISDNETSESPVSGSVIHTSSHSGTENRSFRDLYRAYHEKKQMKRQSVDDIEKTLDEYLQKRQLVHKKLKELKEELRLKDARYVKSKAPPPKKVKFSDDLPAQKDRHSDTETNGNIQNVAPKKSPSKSKKCKKQKTIDVEELKKLSEYDLNLMSCCLMKSIDKSAELENAEIESQLKAFDTQNPKQSKNKVKKPVKKNKNDIFLIIKTFNNSPKASSLVESGVIKTGKEGVNNSSNPLSIRTENDVLKVVKGIENSSKSSSVRNGSDIFKVVKDVENSSMSSNVKVGNNVFEDEKGFENSSMSSSVRTENDVFKVAKGIGNSSMLSIIKTESDAFEVVKGVENSTMSSSVRTENDVFMVVKGIENTSISSSVRTENGVFKVVKGIENTSMLSSVRTESDVFKTIQKKGENSSEILNMATEDDGHKIVKEGIKNHMSETSKLSKTESADAFTSEISDNASCDMFENDVSNESDSNQSAFALQSENDINIKEHLSNTAIKRIENSPKTSNNIEKPLPSTAMKLIEEHSLTPRKLITENKVFHTEKESVKNQLSPASDSRKAESKDVCILEITEDYSSFGVDVAERLKKIQDPLVRIKALMGIQQVLLEAEYSVADKK